MEKMRMESVDMTAQNIEKIGALFPNCITETEDEENSTPEKKVFSVVKSWVVCLTNILTLTIICLSADIYKIRNKIDENSYGRLK